MRESRFRRGVCYNLRTENARLKGTEFGGVLSSLSVKLARIGLKSLIMVQNILGSLIIVFFYKDGIEKSPLYFLYRRYSTLRVLRSFPEKY